MRTVRTAGTSVAIVAVMLLGGGCVAMRHGRPIVGGSTIADRSGTVSGTVRDGGSFLDRVKNISCWNTLMDEAAFMNKRWNDFKVA